MKCRRIMIADRESRAHAGVHASAEENHGPRFVSRIHHEESGDLTVGSSGDLKPDPAASSDFQITR
jgi:hypothetical protein